MIKSGIRQSCHASAPDRCPEPMPHTTLRHGEVAPDSARHGGPSSPGHRLARNQARRHHHAVVARRYKLPAHPIAAGTGFVAKDVNNLPCELSFPTRRCREERWLVISPRYTGSSRPGTATTTAVVSLWTFSPTYALLWKTLCQESDGRGAIYSADLVLFTINKARKVETD